MKAPRSVGDVIRAMSAEELAELVQLRPDLAVPRPLDLDELIERATAGPSTQLAIENLDSWRRRVTLALAACPDATSSRHLAALMGAERGHVDSALKSLQRRALVWGGERSWHLTRAARAAFGAHPAGLAPESAMPMSDAEVVEALTCVDDEARAVLDRLLWTNPTGRVAQATRRGSADSKRPVDRLLHARLVRPIDNDTIILPREVALRLREGRLFPDTVSPTVPGWPAGVSSDVVDQAGLGSAFELVGTVEVMLETIGRLQPRTLATGAMAKRDLSTIARDVGGTERALLLMMVAERAGLLATGGATWLPTHQFDQWRDADGWNRWLLLRDAWLSLDALVDANGPALAPGSTIAWAGALRRLAVAQLSAAAPGADITADVLAARIAWLKPSWTRLDLPGLCAEIIDECGIFGLVSLGRRSLLVDADADPGFPQPGTEFLLQSDLTAVTPAPLTSEVGSILNLLADRESSGGAGVHRFGTSSLRRGLDSGWTASEITEWIAEHSLTPVPQSLTYLIDDVAKKHGQVQVQAVSSVLTVDDPVLVDTVLASSDASLLGLRRLAPTVLAAAAEPAELVAFLRGMGLAPVAQDATGARYTTPAPRRARSNVLPFDSDAGQIDATAVVAELLARDEGRKHALAAGNLVEALQGSIGKPGWWILDYVGHDGTPQTAEVRVMALSGGTARLMKKAEGPFTLNVSRMVSIRPV